MMPLGWLLSLAAAAASDRPSEACAEAVLRDLSLSDVPGFRLSDPTAVSGRDRLAVERAVGLLRRGGAANVFVVPSTPETARIAQDRGAKWWLELTWSTDALSGRLRQVDDGLWRAPGPGIVASARAPVDQRAAGPLAPNVQDTAPPGPSAAPAGLHGPPRALGELPGEPLAMAACPAEPATLLVLTRTHLFRVELTNGWAVQAQLPLDGFDRHPTPSRFPLGTVLCTALGRAAFATSDLAEGHEIEPTSLTPQRSLPGIPLAADESGWVLGRLYDGQAAWQGPDDRLLWGYPSGRPGFVLTRDGAIADDARRLTESGLGATVIETDGAAYWVRTGLGPWGGTDTVQLGEGTDPIGEVVGLPMPVRAMTVGRFPGPDRALLLALADGGRTSVQALQVVLP